MPSYGTTNGQMRGIMPVRCHAPATTGQWWWPFGAAQQQQIPAGPAEILHLRMQSLQRTLADTLTLLGSINQQLSPQQEATYVGAAEVVMSIKEKKEKMDTEIQKLVHQLLDLDMRLSVARGDLKQLEG